MESCSKTIILLLWMSVEDYTPFVYDKDQFLFPVRKFIVLQFCTEGSRVLCFYSVLNTFNEMNLIKMSYGYNFHHMFDQWCNQTNKTKQNEQ